MNSILQEIFFHSKANFQKLVGYGFVKKDNSYEYTTTILDGEMRLHCTVSSKGEIFTQVIDMDSNDVYTLFLAENATGVFVGKVKKAYVQVLTDIRDNCFDKTIFKSDYALKLIEYVKNKYGDELEFLWEKSPSNAILRRKDNKKWYAAMLYVKGSVIGLDTNDFVEIVDFRSTLQDIQNLVDNKNYFLGYHMNKKSWLTLLFTDCNLPFDTIKKHIDDSYILANKK